MSLSSALSLGHVVVHRAYIAVTRDPKIPHTRHTIDMRNASPLPGVQTGRVCVIARAVASRVEKMRFVARAVGPRAGRAMVGWFLFCMHVCIVHHVDPHGHGRQQNELIHFYR